ncbi:hypothetical protein ACF8PU_09460 [Pseudomonas sp. GLN_6]|uniref:hypothetical protein n=1 Tax=Pseudomonas sp. GLN_6 TaxID=3367183 RepID=UPI00370CF45A
MSLHDLSSKRLGQVEILSDAQLSPEDMASMNKAREQFDELEAFVRQALIPAIGGYRTELGSQLEAKVMNVRVLTSNFCWKHRHLGQMHDAQEVAK